MLHASGKIPYLPDRLRGLERIALNLWWRSDRECRRMLRAIDPVVWSGTVHNPIAMLRLVEPARLAECARDPDFLDRFDRVLERFDHHMSRRDLWFQAHFPDVEGAVAYFCAEFGLHNSIPIYSGGLGVLAGDHCKAASDLGVPLIGVGLLYSKGYFDQKLNLEGWQESSNEPFDPHIMPLVRVTGADGRHSIALLQMAGRAVHVGAWTLDVGRVRLYLLDTNLDENHPDDRELTYQLYGGGHEHRLLQEWVLGVGGVRVLRALGIRPGAWHANEGHATFMMVERVREEMASGASLDDAVAAVRARTVFTTHTPVPAGHDVFPPDMLRGVASDFQREADIAPEAFSAFGYHPELEPGSFHMTAAALRLSRYVNGVSKVHGQVTRGLWAPLWPGRDPEHVPIGAITNGVHLGGWMSHHLMGLLDEVLGPNWEDRTTERELWDGLDALDGARLWYTHLRLKAGLLNFCREQARRRWKTLWGEASHLIGAGTLLSPEPLTIGFARRFATYKRAHLLFRDEERLRRLLTDPWRPVQIVFAGKAHPADDDAKRVLQRVWAATRDAGFEGRIAFVEDYDMHVAHRLVQGVDLWLNMPRVPLEASGTSGMKAALNGVPQISTLDGWWAEAFEGQNGWAIPRADGDEREADRQDHDALFSLMEREVVPLYYQRDDDGIPTGWVARMKQAIRVGARTYTSRRMVSEYTERYYVPALAGSLEGDDPPSAERLPVGSVADDRA